MKILFSPVGMSDPITEEKDKDGNVTACHDGSMIHICRHHQPNLVILYLSAEALEYEKADARYTKAIALLSQEIGKTIDYRLIERGDLTEVQQFDPFLKEFEEILTKLRAEHPEAEILLNVSSGTPAMKSALQILAAATTLQLTPLQVSTPTKRSNKSTPHCDVEKEWPLVKENAPLTLSRVEVSGTRNMLYSFNKKILCQFIERYDYKGAKIMAVQMGSMLPVSFREMLDGAVLRYDLKPQEAARKFMSYGHNDVISPRCDKNAEYFMLMCIKAERGEYVDLIRAFTPMFLEILFNAIEKQNGIKVADYTDDRYYWNEEKLKASKLVGRFDQVARFHNGVTKGCFGGYPIKIVYSWHLTNLIENLCTRDQEQFVKDTIKLRNFEENGRNLAAHTVRSFTEQEIKKQTGMTPAEMIEQMRRYILQYTSIPVDEAPLERYKRMNTILKDLL